MRNAFKMVLLLSTLSGCVSAEDLRREREWYAQQQEQKREAFSQSMSSWQGMTERQLVDGRGPPSSVYVVGQARYLTYSRSAVVRLPASGGVLTKHCTVTFRLENDVVNDWQADGNGCY